MLHMLEPEDRVPILDLDESVFESCGYKIDWNFLCTKGAVEHMIKQGDGGKIVNISSTAGKKGQEKLLSL